MPVPSDTTLRKRLEKEVAALFRKAPAVKAGASGDRSLPEVVLEGRKRRAEARILDAFVSRGSDELPKELTQEAGRLLRSWSAVGYADGFEPVARFEIRCAQEREIVEARRAGDPEKLLDVLERDYRRKVVERFGRAELRGVQTSHRVVQDLDTVFIPLHLQPSPIFGEGDGKEGLEKLFPGHRLAVPAILREHPHTLIVGAPGSGKTTLTSYLATRAALGRDLEKYGWPKGALPLVLTVRELANSSLTPPNLARHVGCDVRVIRRAFTEERVLLLVDGLDEAREALRAPLVDSIERFQQENPEIQLAITSRPTGAPGEVEKCLPGLEPFRIVDLQPQEADDFIERWCLAAELSLRNDPAEARKEAQRAADNLKRRLAESYSVQKIAVSPLLLNILCIVHRFLGQKIPQHRATLYERCTDALLYEWDRAKFSEGSAIGELDAPAKRRLLMGVARKVHEAHAAEIEEREVRQLFEAKLPDLGRPASDSRKILAEIRDRSGLLVERRPGFFAFSHLTFQEYLCALDFVDRKQVAETVEHFEERWWQEVIVLAAGVPGAEPGSLATRLLAKKKPKAILLAAQCLETAPAMPMKVRDHVEAALGTLVPPKTMPEVYGLTRLGAVAAPVLMRALNFGNLENPSLTLFALGVIHYSPSVPTLVRFVGDPRPATRYLSFDTVGEMALFLLARQAENIDIARLALPSVLGRETRENIERTQRNLRDVISPEARPRLAEVLDILDTALKSARRGKQRPTPARNTAAKPRSTRGPARKRD